MTWSNARKKRKNSWPTGWRSRTTVPRTESLDELNTLIAEYRDNREQRMVYQGFLRRRAALLDAAAALYRLSKEKQKPDAEREPGYQERDWLKIEERMTSLEKSFDKQVDRALLEHHLESVRRVAGRPAYRGAGSLV